MLIYGAPTKKPQGKRWPVAGWCLFRWLSVGPRKRGLGWAAGWQKVVVPYIIIIILLNKESNLLFLLQNPGLTILGGWLYFDHVNLGIVKLPLLG